MMTIVHHFIRLKDLAQDVTGASRPLYVAEKPYPTAYTFAISQAQRYARSVDMSEPAPHPKFKADLLREHQFEGKYIPVVSAIAEHLERGWPIT